MAPSSSPQRPATRSIRGLPLALLLAGALGTLGLSACSGVHHRAHHARAHLAGARVAVVEKGHRHSDRCGHFRHAGKWYYLDGHVHHHDCGHVRVRGVWLLRD